MRLLVVNPSASELPEGTGDIAASMGWTVREESSVRGARNALSHDDITAALVLDYRIEGASGRGELADLLEHLSGRRIATTLVSTGEAPGIAHRADSLIDVVPQEFTAAELRGRLAMIARYHAMLRRMEEELVNMESLSARLKEHFRLIDQEMRLAGRLQRDFLPSGNGSIGQARFATMYRPASWVSGDIFDIIQIDENHTGFFVADAVGHGMAAALLTMFIKRAVTQTTDGVGHRQSLDPVAVLANLNDALAGQQLPNCQFVTACYGVLDHRTLQFHCARGGHPAPLLIRASGSIEVIDPEGGLLGLACGESFDIQCADLRTGDKILLYTDGVELAFQSDPETLDAASYKGVFRSLSHLDVDALLAELEKRLDAERGSIQPGDDVTILALQMM